MATVDERPVTVRTPSRPTAKTRRMLQLKKSKSTIRFKSSAMNWWRNRRAPAGSEVAWDCVATTVFPDHEVSFTILADRDRWGPWGLFGGLPGRKASYILNPEGAAQELGSKVTLQLQPGDVVSYRTCGGGGYGVPHQRDPRAVVRDVREGKIGLERAAKLYRVAIDPFTRQLDASRTQELRREQPGSS